MCDLPIEEKGIVGLDNLGNTCYANAIIQTLRSIPALTSWILKDIIKPSAACTPKQKKWWDTFTQLLKALWSSSRGTIVDPQDYFMSLKDIVNGTIYDMFGELIPNDSHEYYTYLLDLIQRITHQKYMPATDAPEEIAWATSFKNDWSKIVPLLYGQIEKSIICEGCGHISNSYEVFNNIKVDLLDNKLPLIDSIINTFKDEDIEGYSCDACKQKTCAKIRQSIVKCPPYLCISINRFANGFGGRKDTRTFQLEGGGALDLSSLSIEDKYSLMSVIDHHGSMRGGHYTVQIQHIPMADQEGSDEYGPLTGKWYLYDDERVYDLTQCHVSPSSYMLFFRKN